MTYQSDDVTPNNLAKELGLTQQEAWDLRKAVEFGRACPPIRMMTSQTPFFDRIHELDNILEQANRKG